MSDMIAEAMTFLNAQRSAYMVRTITYKRGALEVAIAATVGEEEREEPDEYARMIRVVIRDYIITTADLILGGSAVEPAAGDLIEEADGGVYEVMSPGGDEPCWRHSGSEIQMRIHSKRITAA